MEKPKKAANKVMNPMATWTAPANIANALRAV